ncbi:YdcF family protein [Geomesophilobacter sediminis]|uniref:YdcF family protein n=1 Tax=Geomesophilobacter sediminis TaxID=2798584 RepID=A0A8J7M3W2_9BACT|nr:YdcF family protein [Geomesophilobacter sediminis]MBJ6727711.1 YdcF family protein [Geomesophilobacter sediminis]
MVLVKGLISLIVLLCLVLSVLFVDFVYKTFSLKQREVHADAIVVLTGGRGRVDEGVRLYREGQGRLLFLIGVDPSVRKSELYKGEGSDGVILEQVSRNTLENAIYARDLIMKHHVNSIKLITSRYHMKRATIIFRNALPKDVAVYPHPVDSRNLKEEWWNHGGSFKLLFSEFYKYCMFRFFFLLAPGELRPLPLAS